MRSSMRYGIHTSSDAATDDVTPYERVPRKRLDEVRMFETRLRRVELVANAALMMAGGLLVGMVAWIVITLAS